MLKAIQILGCSSGFISQTLKKPHSGNGLSLISSKNIYTSASLFLHPFSPPKTRSLRVIPMFSTRSESNSDTPSPSSSSVAVRSSGVYKIKYCQWCGGPAKHEIPDGEEKIRAICTLCGKISYQNPKMIEGISICKCTISQLSPSVLPRGCLKQPTKPRFRKSSREELLRKRSLVVGCLIEHDKKILLCKRNIEPSYGLWTLPAGYLEIGESTAEGAVRETWEEAGAEVEVVSPFAQLDIPLIGQTYVIFLAKLKKPHFSPGPESSECCLFELDNIPFDSLAFSSIFVTLNLYMDDVKSGKLKFHYGTINKRIGTGPSDIRAFTLDYHLQV